MCVCVCVCFLQSGCSSSELTSNYFHRGHEPSGSSLAKVFLPRKLFLVLSSYHKALQRN